MKIEEIKLSILNLIYFFYFFRYVHGCVQSCDDVDACNSAKKMTTPKSPLLFILFSLLSYVTEYKPYVFFMNSKKKSNFWWNIHTDIEKKQ